MGKIKILHIIKSLGRGGAETLLPESLKLHDKAAFEFHYIYFLPWKDQMVSEIQDAGGIVTCLEAKDNIKLMLQAGKVIRYCREYKIDLIHCHLPWAGFLGRWVHKRTGIPVLYTEHNKQERYHRITYTLNKFSFNKQSLAIAVSDDVKESIMQNISPSIPVRTILNGVNTESYKRDTDAGLDLRKELKITEKAPVIGTIAVFRFQKRLVEWLKVFKEVHQTKPEVRGVIVGDGPLKEEILAERQRLGLEEVVHMAGLQTEVRPYLSAMDIYMMTSSFEGLPIALLEAMSMECAIASTRAGGIGEVIRNEQEGLLANVDEWINLVPAVTSMLENEGHLKDLAKNARERVVKSFSMKRMVNDLESIYYEFSSVKKKDFIYS